MSVSMYRLMVAVLGAALAGPALAGPTTGNLITSEKLSWRLASQLAADAVGICAANGYSVTATVIDTSGHQQAVVKGDSVALQSLSVSYRKAYTAYAYGMVFDKKSTGELIKAGHGGPADAALNTIPEVMFVPGGVIIRHGSTVLGGLGVSGAPGGDKDEACAAAALAHLQPQIDG